MLHEGKVSLHDVFKIILSQENDKARTYAKKHRLPVIDVSQPGIITGNSQFCVNLSPGANWSLMTTNVRFHVENTNFFQPQFLILPSQPLINHLLQHIATFKKNSKSPSWFIAFITTSPLYMNMLSPKQLADLLVFKGCFDTKSVPSSTASSAAPSVASIPAKLVQPERRPPPPRLTDVTELPTFEMLPVFFYNMTTGNGQVFDTDRYVTWSEFLGTCHGPFGIFRIWDICKHCVVLCSHFSNSDLLDLICRFFQVYINLHKNLYLDRNHGLSRLRTLCSRLQTSLDAKFELY